MRARSGRSSAAPEADRAVPALMVKIGRYPVQAAGLSAVRSLGRLGIAAHVITENAVTPLALSRYRARRLAWPTTGLEDPGELVRGLADLGRRIGQRCVAIATDDEAAILLAEHSAELSEHFLLPGVRPGLPRQLASKHDLFLLCGEHDVPAPQTALVSSRSELEAYAGQATFPVVVKNGAPWIRLRARMVGTTRVVQTPAELLAVGDQGHEDFRLLIQQYIPFEHSEHWFVHLYCDANSDCLALFTGIKARSWPPHAGMTSCGYSVFNPVLAHLASSFCKAIGYQGVADLDWCLDRRDGQYKLVDFNPRVGNQFSLFATRTGIDVVRALHLDLTGRPVPPGEQVDGRRYVLEYYDLPARFAYRKEPAPSAIPRTAKTVRAFAARDDMLPFLAMWPPQVKPILARALGAIRARVRPRRRGSQSAGTRP